MITQVAVSMLQIPTVRAGMLNSFRPRATRIDQLASHKSHFNKIQYSLQIKIQGVKKVFAESVPRVLYTKISRFNQSYFRSGVNMY